MVFFRVYYSLLQHGIQSCSVEDIVSKYQARAVIANEFFTDDECLCEAVR